MADDLPFVNMKFVDPFTKDLVHGYLRTHITPHADIAHIPDLVLTTCILFYYQREYFLKQQHKIRLNKTQDIASISSARLHRCTVYGVSDITYRHNTMYTWELKVLQYDERYNIYIGIDSSRYPYWFDRDFTDNTTDAHYSYACSARIYSPATTEFTASSVYGSRWGQGDIVKMQLNCKDKTLRYYVNGIDQGVAFEDIEVEDKTYHLAVGICTKLDDTVAVQIVSFKQTHCK